MTTQHTPGPWEAKQGSLHPYRIFAGPRLIADIHIQHCQDANANLIAAAPDLLELLKQCEEVLAGDGHEGGIFIDEIRSAIARAEGHGPQ
ncbi:MAG: hypothetical protein M0Z99_13040 [Betaproteobacteria bacterium]|nr:hypothetical protein [Betaproteobacteria bacterium]